jgi:hypothetical protein
MAGMRAWRVADIGARLARNVPTWVPAALWYPAVAVGAAFAAVALVVGVAGVLLAVVDLSSWRVLGALWTVAVGAAAAAWCVDEVRAWRRMTRQR